MVSKVLLHEERLNLMLYCPTFTNKTLKCWKKSIPWHMLCTA